MPLNDTIINELLRKKTSIIKNQIKPQHSNQESIENTSAVYQKEIELLEDETKKKEDVMKTLLDTTIMLTAAKLQPVTKPIPSFVVDSATIPDLNSRN